MSSIFEEKVQSGINVRSAIVLAPPIDIIEFKIYITMKQL